MSCRFGLKGLTYLDKPSAGQRVEEANDPIVFRGEVDRMYIGGGSREVRIADQGNAEIVVRTSGFKDFVVWNPHAEKARGMADLGEDNYSSFVCVEAGSVNETVQLEAGAQWEGAQGLSLRIKEGATGTQ